MGSTPNTSLIGQDTTWIEGEAIKQLERTAALDGMVRVAGMPDLHPGRGTPIGAAFFSKDIVYPYLVGNDIGCGMGLWRTDIKVRKAKLDKLEKRVRNAGLDGPWNGDAKQWLGQHNIQPCGHEKSLGTVGGGNHFAELLQVHQRLDEPTCDALGLQKDICVLLVHSGSRGFGQEILRDHVDAFADGGLILDSEEGRGYLARHNHAVRWAQANRALITLRMAQALGCETAPVLDITHNSVTAATIAGDSGWLHRKGAAPTDQGIVAIPGSRGTATYLMQPTGDGVVNCQSLAHGAGRKWKRSEVKGRLRSRFSVEDLGRTSLGGRVICDDRDILYEEAPQAYKNIDSVIAAMVDAGVAKVVAILHPMLTYKTVQR